MFGSRYYNSNECWSTSYLSSFQYSHSPIDKPDELVKMTMKVKKTKAIIDVGAYFTSTDKAALADSHQFFQGLRSLPKQEFKYFPQKMDCFKEVNNWFYGFGFFDVYGIAYQLNPTMEEYMVKTTHKEKKMDFIDLFVIFLDIFRGFKVIFEKDYYIRDFGEDDIGINLFNEEDGTTTIQGRIRTLHDFKKGSKSSKCNYESMNNYTLNKQLYVANTGKSKIPNAYVSICQNLNIAGALDIFENYASKAILQYYRDSDSNFNHCFNENFNMPKRCPESLRPIWDNDTNRYLYRSIRKMVLKWTTSSVINHLINLFELLRDKEIARLNAIEQKKLKEIEEKKQEQEKLIKEKQKELMKLVVQSIQKMKTQKIEPSHSNSSLSEDESEMNSVSSNDQASIQIIKKKTVQDDERSETTDDFMNAFNISSMKSSEVSETILSKEKELQSEVANEEQRIRDAMKDLLKNKLYVKKDDDEDVLETGEVKSSYKKIVETAEDALVLEESKEKIIKQMKKNLQDQIEAVKNKEARKLELQRMDTIQDIMERKEKIDVLKEAPDTTINRNKLNEEVDQINEKLDLAIKKYGSDKEIVNSKQVVITLGTLKRELDPYYLKKNIKNYGTLTIQNQENDFIFL
jgi:hypothetical protein